MKRQTIENFIGFLLILLTTAIASIGVFTYINLSEIVNDLETDTNPNTNLILYKEIMVVISSMENKVESYELTGKRYYLDKYDQSVNTVIMLLDSLNQSNSGDIEMFTLNDSLEHLIDKKTALLNDLLALSFNDSPSDMTDLKAQIEKLSDLGIPDSLIPSSKSPDTIRNVVTTIPQTTTTEQIEEKKGFLQRLFSKKEEPPKPKERILEQNVITIKEEEPLNRDSILLAQASHYQSELSETLAKIQAQSKETNRYLREKRMTLQNAHTEIQNQLIELIGRLESRETIKVKSRARTARELAGQTNEQLIIFSSLTLTLLLTTSLVLITYIRRNKKYQSLLRDAKQSTEALAHAKERFFANMSHEIRTPMNAISGFTKILMRSDLQPDQREHVEIISKASDHLLKLLNDILDFSKLQADKLQLEQTIFDFKELCQDTCLLFKEPALEKGITLTAVYENVPEYVLGDPYRLKQILINLLNNSVKFTDSGAVTLKITGTRVHEEVSDLQIEVIDTGRGIPEQNQHRLFREFEQSDQSSFSKGTGLGLAITKRLVMLHNGSITLKSAEGQGTTVTVNMQYQLSAEPPKAPAEYIYHDELKGFRVLIADDEPFNIKLLSTLLDKHQIKHDAATNGQEALDLLQTNTYDAVLLDVKMPELSGWEVAERIKSNPGPNQDKLFIALTATVAKLDTAFSERHGFDYILRKPFDEKELFELIGMRSDSEVADTPMENPAEKIVDLTALAMMGDRYFVEDMVSTFIQSASEGWETVEKELIAKNYDAIAGVAHRIVAPARHLKAHALVTLLKEMETNAKNGKPISEALTERTYQELQRVISALKEYLEKEQIT